jgi:RNA polymerase primary sigma factor
MQQWLNKLSKDLPTLSIGQFGGKRKDSFRDHHIIVATVQSASRTPISPATSDGLLIADEVHRYGTEKFARALNENYSQRLGLTATYERQDFGIEEFLRPYFKPSPENTVRRGEIVAGCSYARGLADGILAPFKVGLIPIRFTYHEQQSYNELDGKARSRRNKLIHNHGCPAEPFGEFIKAVEKLSKGNNDDPQGTGLARGYLDVFTKRKTLLAESHHKLQALQKLVPLLDVAHNGIVFTNTKNSAEKAARILHENGIPAMAYTSDLNQDERKSRLSEFRSGNVRVLAAPRVLDEGIDVPEADVGIIVSANSSRRQMIQRMGRIIRPKGDGRTAKFFILYIENTSEDPNLGAHEVFIGEMMDTAQDVKYFKANVAPEKLLQWYSAN